MIVIATKEIADKCRVTLTSHLNGEPQTAISPVELKDRTYAMSEKQESDILKISGVAKKDYTKRAILISELKTPEITK